MIRNEEAFAAALPADFDGVFSWDVLRYFLLRNGRPTDWDAVIAYGTKARDFDATIQLPMPPSDEEIKSGKGIKQNQTHIMAFETKPPGAPIESGQWNNFRVAAWSGLFTCVAMWRKDFEGPFEWMWMHRDDNGAIHYSPKRETEPSVFLHFFAVWAAAADSFYTQDAMFRLLLQQDSRSSEVIETKAREFFEAFDRIYLDANKRQEYLLRFRRQMADNRQRHEFKPKIIEGGGP